MNEALRETLKKLYDNEICHNIFEDIFLDEKAKDIMEQPRQRIEAVEMSWEDCDEIESAVSASENIHGFYGFLKGYEYCLTMMNLCKGGGYFKWLIWKGA